MAQSITISNTLVLQELDFLLHVMSALPGDRFADGCMLFSGCDVTFGPVGEEEEVVSRCGCSFAHGAENERCAMPIDDPKSLRYQISVIRSP